MIQISGLITGDSVRNLSRFFHRILLINMENDELEEVCEFCYGTGEVSEDIFDEDSHEYMKGVGTRKCLCQLENVD